MKSILLPLRDRLYVPLASTVMWMSSYLTNRTLGLRMVGEEKIRAVHDEGKHIIFAAWHEATFSMFYYYRKRDICVIPVDNYLGSILASFLKKYGFKTIIYPERGSAARRIEAITRLIRKLKEGNDCAIAVDGPPDEKRHTAKPGVFLLAKRTGFPIIPLGVHYDRSYRLGFRWDKYLLPKFFARAVIFLGDPIYVDKNIPDSELPRMCDELGTKIHEAMEKAKEACLAK